MGKPHDRPRSPLTGQLPLHRGRDPLDLSSARNGLQILRSAFPKLELGLPNAGTPSPDLNPSAIAELSSEAMLAVPRSHGRLPLHVLGTGQPQPWELLPMRAAALARYPNFFGLACNFFGLLHSATLTSSPSRLIRPSRIAFDLAKVLRNLGILAGFEVVQRLDRCTPDSYVWPVGQEPEDFTDLALYPYMYLKLNLRWDAHRPVWQRLDAPAAQVPLFTADPIPFAVRNISRPSMPVLMRPGDISKQAALLPAGVTLLWHHELGLTVDAITQHYDVPALALAHLSLPPSQVAQIRAGLRAKAESEAGLPLSQTQPLQKWSLIDWVRDSLEQRSRLLAEDSSSPATPSRTQAGRSTQQQQEQASSSSLQGLSISKQTSEILKRAKERTAQDLAIARSAGELGEKLHNELVAHSLRDKLAQLEDALSGSLSQSSPATSPTTSGTASGGYSDPSSGPSTSYQSSPSSTHQGQQPRSALFSSQPGGGGTHAGGTRRGAGSTGGPPGQRQQYRDRDPHARIPSGAGSGGSGDRQRGGPGVGVGAGGGAGRGGGRGADSSGRRRYMTGHGCSGSESEEQ